MIATMPWGTEIPLASWALCRRQATARSVRSSHANMAATSTTRSWSPVQRCSFRFGKKAHCSRPARSRRARHGEVNLTAIETALTGTCTLILHKRNGLRFPRAETDTHFIAMGMNAGLDDAAKQALREMIAWIGELSGLSAQDAYMLCSLDSYVRSQCFWQQRCGLAARWRRSSL
jgi:hypothetical protein